MFAHSLRLLVLAALVAPVRAEDAEWWAVVELDDDSRIHGTPVFDAIEVRTPKGDVRIPLGRVASAGLENGRWTGSMRGEDDQVFEGGAVQASFRLKTIVGVVDVPTKHVRAFDLHATSTVSARFPSRRDVILHFPFDRPSRTRIRNRATFRHHALVKGAKWTANGHRGGAMEFDGTSTLEIPHHSDLCPKQFTLAAWVRPDDHSGWRLIVSKTDTGSWYGGYGFCRYPDDDEHLYFYAGNYSAGSVKERIPQKQWTHVAGTFDGENVRMYVNGEPSDPVPVANAGGPFVHTETPFLVGGGSNYNWTGRLDELVLYRRALTVREIEALMVATSPRPIDSGNDGAELEGARLDGVE